MGDGSGRIFGWAFEAQVPGLYIKNYGAELTHRFLRFRDRFAVTIRDVAVEELLASADAPVLVHVGHGRGDKSSEGLFVLAEDCL